MSLISEKCIEYNEIRKVCVAEQHGKKYVLNNESMLKIRTVRVDQCFAEVKNEKRCDFLMSIDEINVKRVFFIELKGNDQVQALKQLYSTVVYLKHEFKNYQIEARIVGKGDVPGFVDSIHYRTLAKQIFPTKGTIERGTNKFYSENV